MTRESKTKSRTRSPEREPGSLGDDARYFSDPARVAKSMRQVESPRFWRELRPDLAITSEPFARLRPVAVSSAVTRDLIEQLVDDGYFQSTSLISKQRTARLAAAVGAVVEKGLHPLFAAVYDEFWRTLASLDGLWRAILGGDFLVHPDFWVWHVDPTLNGAGWKPHRDHQYRHTLRPDGRPTVITAWIPLTDATPLSSCIYVLPLSRDPNYPTKKRAKLVDRLQDIRALPAPAGSILGWNQHILHWGSRGSPRSRVPRISFAIYLQSGDAPRWNEHARPLAGRLSFDERLAYVARALERYSQQFPLPKALEAFVRGALG